MSSIAPLIGCSQCRKNPIVMFQASAALVEGDFFDVNMFDICVGVDIRDVFDRFAYSLLHVHMASAWAARPTPAHALIHGLMRVIPVSSKSDYPATYVSADRHGLARCVPAHPAQRPRVGRPVGAKGHPRHSAPLSHGRGHQGRRARLFSARRQRRQLYRKRGLAGEDANGRPVAIAQHAGAVRQGGDCLRGARGRSGSTGGSREPKACGFHVSMAKGLGWLRQERGQHWQKKPASEQAGVYRAFQAYMIPAHGQLAKGHKELRA